MRNTLFIFFIALSVCASAQVEMADTFRGEGKIYIVVAIVLLILLGFFLLLFRLDKKTQRLESDMNDAEEDEN